MLCVCGVFSDYLRLSTAIYNKTLKNRRWFKPASKTARPTRSLRNSLKYLKKCSLDTLNYTAIAGKIKSV